MGHNDTARSSNYLGIDVHKALLDRANGWAAARGLSGNVSYVQANVVVSAAAILGSYPGRRVRLVSIQYPDPQQRRRRHVVGRQLVAALAEVLPPGCQVYLNSDFEDTATYMRNCFECFGSQHFEIDAAAHAPGATFPCSAMLQPVRPDLVGRPRAARANAATSRPESGSVSGSESEGGSVSDGSGSGSEEAEIVDEEEVDMLQWRGRWREAGWLLRNPVGAPTEREVYVELATKQQVYRVMLVRR
ncbi:hypothetical protein HYH02_003896 [Chlamydomonas schloesseri]|uniref:tRNA (guanine(46)-N(7))-methyltransferase n=1 Tax=Chlamydomonas schloesseri TaxID=2026947 RepID=A0A835WRH0_9CHLO|nr:hypothetical protein HYH02_003896 [Chlamydomonas schloesseri]|eukprot:KAG2451290.1 hypothetical protein HYH02_003896 [Chlamydomonas schloesseri]